LQIFAAGGDAKRKQRLQSRRDAGATRVKGKSTGRIACATKSKAPS
jgi:hypothetical protein